MKTSLSKRELLGGSVLLLIGAILGFGSAHLSYRWERAQLIAGYYFTTSERPELAWLETADPLADFREAVAKNDLRFIGVHGGGASTPWVPGVPDTHLADRKQVRFLPVGATCWPNEINKDLDRAMSYARVYNTLLLQYSGQ